MGYTDGRKRPGRASRGRRPGRSRGCIGKVDTTPRCFRGDASGGRRSKVWAQLDAFWLARISDVPGADVTARAEPWFGGEQGSTGGGGGGNMGPLRSLRGSRCNSQSRGIAVSGLRIFGGTGKFQPFTSRDAMLRRVRFLFLGTAFQLAPAGWEGGTGVALRSQRHFLLLSIPSIPPSPPTGSLSLTWKGAPNTVPCLRTVPPYHTPRHSAAAPEPPTRL